MKTGNTKVITKQFLFPFMIITSLFALWGFANDITNPMVAAFGSIMEISTAKASLIQFAFYGGYGTMAIPAALFARKYSYKKGILLGLALYALGALLFFPAAKLEMFGCFCLSLYILTFGLAFLETTASPYIMSMGSEKTATRRLNFAQSFNPLGSLAGMFVASNVILASLQSEVRDASGELVYGSLDAAQKAAIRTHDLGIIEKPYVILGLVILVVFLVIFLMKMPDNAAKDTGKVKDSFKRLFANKRYREGVVAQIAYMASQIMCWTFIIQYAENLGIDKASAQRYNMLAMLMFVTFRFLSTYLMKYVNPRKMLMYFAIGAMLMTTGTIFIQGFGGLVCLIMISAFMSLMFPTIYGIALEGLGVDTTLGASGLVLGLVGGALMPPIQGMIIDLGQVGFLPAVNFSFILPFLCFIIVGTYGYRSYKMQKNERALQD